MILAHNAPVVWVGLLLVGGALAQTAPLAPLPTKIISAKSIYLLNESGDIKLGNAVYRQLVAWNRWKIVQDRDSADLVGVVSYNSTAFNRKCTLVIEDAATREQLWVVTTGMKGRPLRTWNAMAKDLVDDISKRMK
ncbi:MAG: hypothetical protein WA188_11320 [Terriglobales bacterium]